MRRWPERVLRAGASALRAFMQGARLAIGLPDYLTYERHMATMHPERTPMDRETFFRDRMEARYGRGRSRCC